MLTKIKPPKNSDVEILLKEKGTEVFKTLKRTDTTNASVTAEKAVLEVDGTTAASLGYGKSWYIEDGAGTNEEMARHVVVMTTATDGSESAEHQFWCKRSGVMTKILTIDGAATVTADGNLSFTAARTVTILDNTDNAWSVVDSGGSPLTYLEFDSRDAAPLILVSQNLHIANNMDIIPATAGGNDLGSTSKEWGDIFLADSKSVKFGDAQDMALSWDATNLVLTSVAANTGALVLGVSGEGIDLQLYGATTGYDVLWDESADTLIFNDGAKAQFGTTAGCATISASTTTLSILAVSDNNTIEVGAAGNSFDLKIWGSAAGNYFTFDTSANILKFEDNVEVNFGTNTAGVGTAGDVRIRWDGTDLDMLATANNSVYKIGNGTNSFDTWVYGSSTSHGYTWDASANIFKFEDDDVLHFGTNGGVGPGNVGDISMRWDATDFDILCAADDTVLKIGNGTNSFDIWLYGNAASTYVSWDASADSLKLEDNVFLGFGTNTAGPGTKGDINITWNATKLLVAQTTTNSAIDFGVSGAGIDLQLYGDTVAADLLWDQSADSLIFGDNAKVVFGTGSDVTIAWDGTDLDITCAADNSTITVGASGNSFDLKLFGSGASDYVTWDASAGAIKLEDNVVLGIGSNTAGVGTLGDIQISWNATKLLIAQATTNSAIDLGVDGAGIDLVFYGDTASAKCMWDQSADELVFSGGAILDVVAGQFQISNVAVNATAAELNMAADISANSEVVTATNVIAAAESGTTYYLDAIGGFTSTLPAPAQGMKFIFIVKTAPTTAYIITTNSGSNILYGTTVERAGGAGVAGAAQDTVNFVANQAIINDRYVFESDGTNWYMHGVVDVAAACTFSVT